MCYRSGIRRNRSVAHISPIRVPRLCAPCLAGLPTRSSSPAISAVLPCPPLFTSPDPNSAVPKPCGALRALCTDNTAPCCSSHQITSPDPKSVPEPVLAAVASAIKSKSQTLEVNEQGSRVRRKIVSESLACPPALEPECAHARARGALPGARLWTQNLRVRLHANLPVCVRVCMDVRAPTWVCCHVQGHERARCRPANTSWCLFLRLHARICKHVCGLRVQPHHSGEARPARRASTAWTACQGALAHVLYFASQPLGNAEVVSAEIDARSLYAKPFPMDANLDKVRRGGCGSWTLG